MISTNELSKVPKLIIEVPEYDTPEAFPPYFASRLSLGKLSPISKTPKHCKTTGNFRCPSSAGSTPIGNSSPPQNKFHRVPLIFINNSNNLKEKGVDGIENSQDTVDMNECAEKYNQIYKEHLLQTYQSLKLVQELRPVDLQQLRSKRITIPRRKGYEYKKTVIFDLDETLVHCCDDTSVECTVVLPIVFSNGDIMQAPISIRPYALECLKKASKNYEVIVFTASQQCYADAVLDYLDPEREIIHHRFYRQHCVLMDGMYIKDLRIFANRRIKDMIIVDNFVHSFAYQLENGVPIISWVDYQHDIELHGLIYYLKKLIKVEDVRETNKKIFRLNTFVEEFIRETNKSTTCNSIDI